jgi:anaerobic selenocysteine-containing dehydrogenase
MAPLGEAKSNWEVFSSWLSDGLHRARRSARARRRSSSTCWRRGARPVRGITWERLLEEGTCRLNYPRPDGALRRREVPHAERESGAVQPATRGRWVDPLPNWAPDVESRARDPERARRYPLQLVSAASHHFLNSSFGNVPTLRRLHGDPSVEIHPEDAAPREIVDGEWVEVANDRGSFRRGPGWGRRFSPGTLFSRPCGGAATAPTVAARTGRPATRWRIRRGRHLPREPGGGFRGAAARGGVKAGEPMTVYSADLKDGQQLQVEKQARTPPSP